MENQINMGDQNTQQIGQKPVSQPVEIPEKSRINYWVISTILLLAVVLLGGVWFLLNIKNGKIPSSQQTNSTQG